MEAVIRQRSKRAPMSSKPRRYFLFKLVSLNRIFRTFGFVLVIMFDDDGPTTIYFSGRRAYDDWASQFEQKRTK